MTPVRALHLMVRRKGGGTETNVTRLCESTPGFEAVALEELVGHPAQWSRSLSAIRALRARRPEVVFCYGIRAHVFATVAFPWGTPLVGSIRCESDFDGAKGVVKGLISWRFSEWVSNSRAGLKGGAGRIIYNGVPPPPDEAALLAGLKGPVFGVLASGHRKKGHDFLLELWRSLGKPGTMVFAGSLGEELKQRSEREGVLCPGFVAPGPLLRSLDLLLVPSTAEGIPTVLLEAMVRGVPCLSTPVSGIPELIRHGEDGFLLPREGWREFLDKLPTERLGEVGEAGRRKVLRDFAFDRMQREFVEVAERVAKS